MLIAFPRQQLLCERASVLAVRTLMSFQPYKAHLLLHIPPGLKKFYILLIECLYVFCIDSQNKQGRLSFILTD
jgi:hypothetical protein